MSNDPLGWVSATLREASGVLFGCPRDLDKLLLRLADRAEFIERNGVDPIRESNWGMVFAHAVMLATGVVEDAKDATD